MPLSLKNLLLIAKCMPELETLHVSRPSKAPLLGFCSKLNLMVALRSGICIIIIISDKVITYKLCCEGTLLVESIIFSFEPAFSLI